MTGGTDIQEFEEEYFEVLIEDFTDAHETEYWEYFDGTVYITVEQQQHWALSHPEWARFVEIEYATRTSGPKDGQQEEN